MYRPIIRTGEVTKGQLLFNIFIATIYFSWWLIPSHVGNPFLYSMLLVGEIYHVTTAYMFWYTLWSFEKIHASNNNFLKKKINTSVDIFITVAGEPLDVVKKTIQAAKKIIYEKKKIYILNDGFVAGQKNWNFIEKLADDEGVVCITRKKIGGAKAGNINNGLSQTNGEIVVVFDADMQAFPDFLSTVLPYFTDPKVGFVQTPQYYQNNAINTVSAGSWEQQEFFFGPIMRGKDTSNSAFICGTNFAIRRIALEQVGGMDEKNI